MYCRERHKKRKRHKERGERKKKDRGSPKVVKKLRVI
jgi:hypothetical protein